MMQQTMAIDLPNMKYQWSAVFAKTALGKQEVAQRKAGLGIKQRAILIMLDGIKPLQQLIFPVEDAVLEDILDILLEKKLIELAYSAKIKSTHLIDKNTQTANLAIEPAPLTLIKTQRNKTPVVETVGMDITRTSNDKTLANAKLFMINTAQLHLGLLSTEVAEKIEKANSIMSLNALVGQWHMALRDSRSGHAIGGSVEQLKRMLLIDQ